MLAAVAGRDHFGAGNNRSIARSNPGEALRLVEASPGFVPAEFYMRQAASDGVDEDQDARHEGLAYPGSRCRVVEPLLRLRD